MQTLNDFFFVKIQYLKNVFTIIIKSEFLAIRMIMKIPFLIKSEFSTVRKIIKNLTRMRIFHHTKIKKSLPNDNNDYKNPHSSFNFDIKKILIQIKFFITRYIYKRKFLQHNDKNFTSSDKEKNRRRNLIKTFYYNL